MEFTSIVENIINDSIRTALYIDEEIVFPYENTVENNENKVENIKARCANLYQSFEENNTLLSLYKFDKNTPQWESIKKKLSNSDLLLLDWELDNGKDVKYCDTLKIIDFAINIPNLHFISIYSQASSDEFDEIIDVINIYYSGKKISSDIEAYIIEAKSSIVIDKNIKTIAKEFLLKKEQKELDNLKTLVSSEAEDENIAQKLDVLSDDNNTVLDIWYRFAMILTEYIFEPSSDFHNPLSFDKENKTLIVGKTIISVFPKGNRPNASELLSSLTQGIIKHIPNFLTIAALEIRNKILGNSAFINDSLFEIKDDALLHFKRTSFQDDKTDFFLTIKDIWKEQLASLIDVEELQVYKYIEKYPQFQAVDVGFLPKNFHCNKLTEEIEEKLKSLFQINNFLNLNQNQSHFPKKVGFGDIFQWQDTVNPQDTGYLLCLMPHCDAARPQKVLYNYHFILGSEISICEGLKKPESNYHSFIILEKKQEICIKWETKAFSLHIPNSSRVFKYTPRGSKISNKYRLIKEGRYRSIICIDLYIKPTTQNREQKENKSKEQSSVNVVKKKVNLYYLGTLKENYTQRIANATATGPLRVGVSYAQLND